MTVDEFLVDLVGFHDMDAGKQVEIRAAIEANANANATKGKRPASAASASETESSAKKVKSEKASNVGSTEMDDEVYLLYKAMNIDELKDYLRWNLQVLKGTKVIPLIRFLID
jgi:hypothetical protein